MSIGEPFPPIRLGGAGGFVLTPEALRAFQATRELAPVDPHCVAAMEDRLAKIELSIATLVKVLEKVLLPPAPKPAASPDPRSDYLAAALASRHFARGGIISSVFDGD